MAIELSDLVIDTVTIRRLIVEELVIEPPLPPVTDDRVTADGEPRVTSDGDQRVTEE